MAVRRTTTRRRALSCIDVVVLNGAFFASSLSRLDTVVSRTFSRWFDSSELRTMTFVDFLPAQVDAASSTNALPYTSSPSGLVWSDVKLFFGVLSYFWGIVAPMYPFGSGKLDELYP